MAKKLLPFLMSPKCWGKKGKDREVAEAEYTLDGDELQFELNKIESKYERLEADKLGEPYVNVIRMGVDPDNVVQGYFELDWNDAFVAMLQEKGMQGTSDEDVVNKWFNAVCRTVLLQEQADHDYGMQTGQRDDVIRTTDTRSEGED
jgi:hypothetical protein